MNKIFNWTFGSIFRTLGRIIAYFIIGIIAVMIFNAGGFKKPKISNILNDIFFMKVNASEISLSAKYDSTEYSPYTWTDSQAIQYDIVRYKLINFDSTTQNSVHNEQIKFNTNFNTNNYDLIEIPFFLSNSIVAWQVNDNFDMAYCDTYYQSGSDIECLNPRTWTNPFDTNAIKFNNNNFQFMLDYVGGGVTQCTYNNNVIVCPLTKNKIIRNINVYYTFAGANFSTYDKFYMNIGQYINFYKYVDSSTDIINNATSNTQNIINNQNQTTQEIINNQNASTNATIENQNQNTHQQIESQQVCNFIDKQDIVIDNKYLDITGLIYDIDYYGITDYINIIGSNIKVLSTSQSSGASACFYDVNKTKISCVNFNSMNVGEFMTIPTNAQYFRTTINKNQNKPTFNICQNGNQAMANTITDESGPSNISSLSNENMVGWLPPGPVDSLINLPLVLLNSLQNALSSTCSPITLTLPFVNQDIYLPCMSSLYEEMGVSSFVNWAGIVASAFILFSYLMRFYKWVDNTLTFRENNWLDNWGGE